MKKKALLKVFMMNGEIFGAYKRSSAREYFKNNNQKYTGTYGINDGAVYSDIEKSENNIIDLENKYLD